MHRYMGVVSLLFPIVVTESLIIGAKTGAFRLRTRHRLPASPQSILPTLIEGPEIGRGSYGIVNQCDLDGDTVICKRALTLEELTEKNDKPKQRHQRCLYYWEVEKHCFVKMKAHPQLPKYRGVFSDSSGNEYMTFDVAPGHHATSTSQRPAPTLQQVMEADWHSQHETNRHHLVELQQALGLDHVPEEDAFCSTLDSVVENLLQVLCFVHGQHLVHRDVKPANLLVTSGSLVLIDFGSAADMDPIKSGLWETTRVGLEDGNRVAISPIYSAPELFIDPKSAPYQFDVFSTALIVCQLLFNYLDERTDAGFHQQLDDCDCDLDLWLSRELASKVRPAGLEEALEYLGQRRGLWRLLGAMLRKNPEQRVSSKDALNRWHFLKDNQATDGPFFESVVLLVEECEVAPPAVQRPLHFVATFRRHVPLGLVLSEVDRTCTDPEWAKATADAKRGEVYVQSILPDSQADQMGIFEVGDRLQGVGDLPLANRGFEKVVEMLEQQPKASKYVKLHFDRRASRKKLAFAEDSNSAIQLGRSRVVAQGAWSSKGRRKAQEDTFVLHEIHEEQDILLAGIFDGHGGTAASKTASQMVPYLMSETLRQQVEPRHEEDVREALERAWEMTCDTYRHGCLNDEECVADYDPVEGTLQASTGSTVLVAGTTASLAAIQEGSLTVLNCGDSRSVLFGKDGSVLFATKDHSPDVDMERLVSNPAYSTPKCSLSRWYLSVGDYQYAVARSLEGPFATSKGIVSDPDVTTFPVTEEAILVMASDGLFEVVDNEEVGRDVLKLRANGYNAGDAAKELCAMAVERGTSDNVSVVVVYLG